MLHPNQSKGQFGSLKLLADGKSLKNEDNYTTWPCSVLFGDTFLSNATVCSCAITQIYTAAQAACVWGRRATLTALWAAQLILVPSSYINRDPKAILPKWKGGGGWSTGKTKKPSQVSGAEQHSARRYTTSVLTSDSRSKQIIWHPQRHNGDAQAAEQRSRYVHGRVGTQPECVRRNMYGDIVEITFLAVSSYCWALFPPQSAREKTKKEQQTNTQAQTRVRLVLSTFYRSLSIWFLRSRRPSSRTKPPARHEPCALFIWPGSTYDKWTSHNVM